MKHARTNPGAPFWAKLVLFCVVSAVWLALDRASKLYANRYDVGEVFVQDIAGLFEFKLVRNTGAAWGIFSDSTLPLGLFSLLVCVLLLVLLFTYFKSAGGMIQVFSLALVFAGGLGNAADRLLYSYVIDFINATFVSFPVFNVADIGVTCGIALLLVTSLATDMRVNRPRKDS